MALAYLRSANRAGPKLFIRVNALDTGLTLADLAVVMQGKPDGIVFPKCVGQRDLDLLATYLDALEAREDIAAGSTKILTIATESAAAVLALTAAPAGHARLIGHSWGGEDLMADLGALAKGPAPGVYDDTFRFARTVNLMASVAAGVTAYDTVYPDIRNVDGLRAEAHEARRMGYGGKIAIHPDQVAIIHEVFTPSATGSGLGQARDRHLREQSRLGRADARRQDAGQAAPRAGATPDGTRRMTGGRALLPTLERLFAGPRKSLLHRRGLPRRAGDTLLSLHRGGSRAAQLHPDRHSAAVDGDRHPDGAGRGAGLLWPYSPWLPRSVGRLALSRGRLQDFVARMRPRLERIEATIHPRFSWWVTGVRRRLLHVACALIILILALPIPFDNLFAAWSILFFCLAPARG
jgi:citrate lyase beta subunit